MKNLQDKLLLNNGVTINNRIMMAPMTTKGANWEGYINDNDLKFFGDRSKAAALIVVGATSISKYGEKFPYQMSLYNDSFKEGFSKLAQNIKKDGNKAIVQLYHGGVNSLVSYQKHGKVYGPSNINFNHLDYNVTELTTQEVWNLIEMYGEATKRVIDTGFDGVEIHGAYSHLIQQFFSPYSNKRNDHFGGTLQKRMNFAIEIIKKVKIIKEKYASSDFIIGYRLTEEEYHQSSNDGYTIKETLQLIDVLANMDLDYIQTTDNKFASEIYNLINHRTIYITTPHTFSAQDTEDALQFADMVSLARATLIEIEFAKKIVENKRDSIYTEIISTEMAKSLNWTPNMIEWLLDPNGSEATPKGIDYFKPLLNRSVKFNE
jgi:2,4-dienoyl-CoA reductase-like NADH-dependent reductase (Old Yellow Enzyme family)